MVSQYRHSKMGLGQLYSAMLCTNECQRVICQWLDELALIPEHL